MQLKDPIVCKCGAKMKGPLICSDDKRRYICPKCNHQRLAPEGEG